MIEAALARGFRIVRRIGQGSLAEVYQAEQVSQGNRPVVLRVFRWSVIGRYERPSAIVPRFLNELGRPGRIQHPNVIAVLEPGQFPDTRCYLATEYVPGETLRQVLKRRGALPVAECAEILRQVACGLNAGHALGFVHGGIKPENILISRSEEGGILVKVLDFSLHEMWDLIPISAIANPPDMMLYRSVDEFTTGRVGVWSDIYVMGLVAYEMVTGSAPYPDRHGVITRIVKHRGEDAPPFRVWAPGLTVPPGLEAVVLRSLSWEQDRRQASALEFANDFCAAASVEPAAQTSA